MIKSFTARLRLQTCSLHSTRAEGGWGSLQSIDKVCIEIVGGAAHNKTLYEYSRKLWRVLNLVKWLSDGVVLNLMI